MKSLCILMVLFCFGCSDASVADEHPPVIAGNTGVHEPVDWSGLAKAKQSLTSCPKPDGLNHAMTNIIVTSATPQGATCPQAWFAVDVDYWRLSSTTSSPSLAPKIKMNGVLQSCQWAPGAKWPAQIGAITYDCYASYDFVCPNAVRYKALVHALGPAANPWTPSQVSITATYQQGGPCVRTALSAF